MFILKEAYCRVEAATAREIHLLKDHDQEKESYLNKAIFFSAQRTEVVLINKFIKLERCTNDSRSETPIMFP